MRGGCARFQSIRPAPRNCVLFPLPGAEPDSNLQRLSGGRWKPAEGKVDLGTSIKDIRSGGGGFTDLGEFLLGGSPGGTPFWVGYVGDNYPYGKVPGGFPPLIGAMYHGEPPPNMSHQYLELPSSEGCDYNVGTGGTGDLHFQDSE